MRARLARLTRRGRRRLFVVSTAGILGGGAPLWVPQMLATLPAFSVREVVVVGTRYTPPDEIKRLAGIEVDASVWDDPRIWEDRVRQHPMVRDVDVRREGLRTLEIAVVEKRPVALVATPELRPVNGEGRVLPLDPAEAHLDLPVIGGLANVEGEVVADAGVRELALLLEELNRANAEFVSVVSEVSRTPEGAYRFVMLPSADAGVVLLPREDPVLALDRVSIALGHIEDERVAHADARFAGQVVLKRAEAR